MSYVKCIILYNNIDKDLYLYVYIYTCPTVFGSCISNFMARIIIYYYIIIFDNGNGEVPSNTVHKMFTYDIEIIIYKLFKIKFIVAEM